MPQLTPTAEQQAIIDAYRTGQNLVIEAGAGTGKTSTLKMLAAAAPDRSGFYIAYNRAIAKDAGRSFPGNIECRTAHSLAFRAVGSQFKARLDGPRQPARIVAQLLRINPLRVDESLMLSPTQVARVVNDTVANFCRSADAEIAWRHVPKIEGIDLPEPRGRLREAVVPLARKAWADLSRPEGKLRFQHDHYLKLWQLTGPRLDVDVVMLDEAQDANPLIADIVERQTHAQRVMVGDASQAIYCQPAGTMVRVPVKVGGQVGSGGPSWTFQERPIESLQAGDRVISYSQSGQLGAIRKRGCKVTGVTRRPWHGPLKVVVMDSGRNAAYTPDHHCVVMLGDALRGQYPVYLARRGEHYRVGSCEGRYASQKDAFGPLLRARQEGADAIWVLSVHATRRAALAEEALTQTFHNIPGRCFLSEGGTDYWKDRPSNRQAAADLLTAFGLSIDAPLLDLREEPLRADQKHIHTWRSPLVTQARNLLDGMWVLPADRTVRHSRSETVRVSSWEPVKVLDEWYDGEVISISVDGDHTYIADGIVTHNSWNGAVDALSKFDADQRLQLSESFRFGPAIAAEANKWLGIIGAKLRLTGRAGHTSVIAHEHETALGLNRMMEYPDAILCRTNAGAVQQLMAAAEEGRRAALVGGGDAIKRLAEAALDLQQGRPTSHPELVAFATWGQLQEYVEQESAGSDLKVFVRLIDDHGAHAVIDTMDRLVDERYAQVVVSTAHKAKGREWDRVRVADDFRQPKAGKDGEPGEVRDDEAMLAYVTVTRARRVLDRGGLAWVDGWLDGPAPEEEAGQLTLAELETKESESAPSGDPTDDPELCEREQTAATVAALRRATVDAERTLAEEAAEQAPSAEPRPRNWLEEALWKEHQESIRQGYIPADT